MLECVRYALGLEHKGRDARKSGNSIVDDNLGAEHGTIRLGVTSSAQHGARFSIIRRYGEPPRVYDEDGAVSNLSPEELLPGVEVYGQSEIFEIARDPQGLSAVLQRFVPELKSRQQEIRRIEVDLRKNAGSLKAVWDKQESLSARLAQLPALKEKLKRFESIGVAEKLAQVPLLETEQQVPDRVTEFFDEAQVWIDEALDEFSLDWVLTDEETSALPHAELIDRAQSEVSRMTTDVRELLANAKKAISASKRRAEKLVAELRNEIDTAAKSLEKEFSKLPDVGNQKGEVVGRTYQKLQRDIKAIQPLVAQRKVATKEEAGLEAERRQLLNALADARAQRASEYRGAVKRLNRRLAGLLRMRVVANADRGELKAALSELPGIGEKSLDWIDAASEFTVPGLIEACLAGAESLQERWGVTPAKARSLAAMDRLAVMDVEVIDLGERIDLELNIGTTTEEYRPIGRLSTGQQCTAILSLLLLENLDPLIVDQPEDNLDNAYIAEHIVTRLRSMKVERQFIFATHNANIPVLGDAEWIGVCAAMDGRGGIAIDHQGAIDATTIRDAAAMILDGGREAFRLRWEKYGY